MIYTLTTRPVTIKISISLIIPFFLVIKQTQLVLYQILS